MLFERGTDHICQKVGVEAVETVISALRGTKRELVGESADLIYHLLVLWADAEVEPQIMFGTNFAEEKTSLVSRRSCSVTIIISKG